MEMLVAKFALQTRLSHYIQFLSGIKGQQYASLRLLFLTILYTFAITEICSSVFFLLSERNNANLANEFFFAIILSDTVAQPNTIPNDFLPTDWI